MTNRTPVSRFFGGAAVLAVTFFGLAEGAQAQVTDAMRSAIRSSCRSDYMANCSSVTPGGIEALQCLQRNESKLSGSCRSAVGAATAAEKPAATPAAAAPAETPATEKNAPARPAASPRPTTAAAPPSAGSPPPARKPPAAAPKAAATAPAAAPADTGPPPPPPPLPLAEIPPRFELQIVRSCRPEVRTICALPAGGGRILNCLAANEQNVSPACQAAIQQARAAAR